MSTIFVRARETSQSETDSFVGSLKHILNTAANHPDTPIAPPRPIDQFETSLRANLQANNFAAALTDVNSVGDVVYRDVRGKIPSFRFLMQ
jgi:hypothetical protein